MLTLIIVPQRLHLVLTLTLALPLAHPQSHPLTNPPAVAALFLLQPPSQNRDYGGDLDCPHANKYADTQWPVGDAAGRKGNLDAGGTEAAAGAGRRKVRTCDAHARILFMATCPCGISHTTL